MTEQSSKIESRSGDSHHGCYFANGCVHIDLSAPRSAIQETLDQYERLRGLDPKVIDRILSDTEAARVRHQGENVEARRI